MQRIAKFFKGSNKSSSLHEEREQMRLKREELIEKLKGEQRKTRALENEMETVHFRMNCLFMNDTEVRNNDALEKQVERQEEEIEVLEKAADENEYFLRKFALLSESCGFVLSPEVLKNFVLNEKKQTVEYRLKAQKAREQLKEAREKPSEQRKPWKFCEVCELEFAESEQRVPRVLACGHTLCHSCATEKSSSGILICPFDGHFNDLRTGKLESLPKNFTVLHM